MTTLEVILTPLLGTMNFYQMQAIKAHTRAIYIELYRTEPINGMFNPRDRAWVLEIARLITQPVPLVVINVDGD
eukprot:3937891-Rhodomonas_salina.3